MPVDKVLCCSRAAMPHRSAILNAIEHGLRPLSTPGGWHGAAAMTASAGTRFSSRLIRYDLPVGCARAFGTRRLAIDLLREDDNISTARDGCLRKLQEKAKTTA
ncbi:hypothetical protein [Reyranella sp. CPCC 100927]|uniref:hypothetical protein n=1 Tax=Reyranella sp. CPCC 100927 TaxID=2599616 RepID=UPI0015B57646|nr:hypothetical protein [Reyranella sp. CPCC 100927]